MPVSRRTIDEILEKANIYEIVSSFVALKRAGRNYIGLCPFHADTKPSFTVSEEKNLFYCFGCQKGGTPIHFLMEAKNLTFAEAVEELAKRYGIKIDFDQKKLGDSYKLKQTFLDINGKVKEFFKKMLKTQAGERAANYIRSRGITDELVQKFELGYAPDSWDALYNHLKSKGFGELMLEAAGLVVRGTQGNFHDRFRDRIMFPIVDAQGNTIAFGGRIIDQGEPKYLNSPETEVFKKGSTLFGLYQARQGMRERAIVVEGNFDCIVMHQYGFSGTVATLGTALTSSHVRVISKYTDKLALIFDGDDAGQRALERSAEIFAAHELQPLAVVLPKGEDPDSFCRKSGSEALTKLIEQSHPILEHMIYLWAKRAGGPVEGRAKAANAVAELLALVKDGIRRDLLLQLASDRLKVKEESLRAKLSAIIRGKTKNRAESSQPLSEKACLLSPAKTIFEAFVKFPDLVDDFLDEFSGMEKELEDAQDVWSRALAKILKKGGFEIEELLADPNLSELAGQLSEMELKSGSFDDAGKAKKAVYDCASKLLEKKFKEELIDITHQLKDAQDKKDESKIASLLKHREETNARWRKLWQKTRGRTG